MMKREYPAKALRPFAYRDPAPGFCPLTSMSSFSNILALTRQFSAVVGPAEPLTVDSLRPTPPAPPSLSLQPPRDLRGPLQQMGVAPKLASLIASHYESHAQKSAHAIVRAYGDYSAAMDTVTSRIWSQLSPDERTAFLRGHDNSGTTIFIQRYLSHLQHVEKIIFELVAAKRACFSPARDRRQVQRKGFAKVRRLSSPPFPLFAAPRLELTSASLRPSSQKSVEILRKVRLYHPSSSSNPFDGDVRAHLHRSTSSSASLIFADLPRRVVPQHRRAQGHLVPHQHGLQADSCMGSYSSLALFAFVRRSLVHDLDRRLDGRGFPLIGRPSPSPRALSLSSLLLTRLLLFFLPSLPSLPFISL